MNKNKNTKEEQRKKRQARVRSRIFGTADRPRLNVHKSLRNMFLQLIDDSTGKTLVSANSKKDIAKGEAGDRKGKTAQAYLLGKTLAEKAKAEKIEEVVFDRAGYKYQGRIQATADGARDGGLKF